MTIFSSLIMASVNNAIHYLVIFPNSYGLFLTVYAQFLQRILGQCLW